MYKCVCVFVKLRLYSHVRKPNTCTINNRTRCVSDILLPHVVRDTTGDHMHPVRADADETVERSEPGRTAAVGREPEGQETRDPNGRGRGRHIRILLVPDTGETPRYFVLLCC